MQHLYNSWRVRNLLVMMLRLIKSLRLAESIMSLHPPSCSGPAPTFVPVYSVYSTPQESSAMPEKTSLTCPGCSCRKKFTLDSCQPKHITLHHPELLQVERQENLTIRSATRRVEPAQRGEFNTNEDPVNDLNAFPHLEQVETIADLESQPQLTPMP